MIYVDNAATTRLCDAALQAMLPLLQEGYGNPSSLHRLGQEANRTLYQSRAAMARCLGCTPRELTFTSGGTESNNMALRSAAEWGRRNGRLHILSTAFEHHAVLRVLDRLAQEGFEVERLSPNAQHNISVEQVSAALRPDTCLVTAMFANNEVGSLLPIAELGALCRERGVLLHTDAVQVVGHLPLDLGTLGVDYLSLSAHKLHGPKGVGALYVRRGAPLSSLLLGGGQERGLRAGTENLPAIAGMSAALVQACDGMGENLRHVTALRSRLREGLSTLEGVHFNGDEAHHLPGLLSLCIDGVESESLLLLLDQKGICAGGGAACSAGSLEPSHVLLSLGRTPAQARSALRLSLSAGNTMDEVEQILRAIPPLVGRLRRS